MTNRPVPGKPFPELEVPLAGGGSFVLSENRPPFMTVLNVYRGLHCPRCRRQLEDFVAHLDGLTDLGADLVSVSMDPADRAEKTVAEWNLSETRVGYGLSEEQARGMGLYISDAIKDAENAIFAEAGLFLVRPDGTYYGGVVNTFPFMRPTAEMLIDALNMAVKGYPPRGARV
ncbi:MAG: redoxin domain-containing protein [Paracoccaceae bacterium]